MKRTAIGGGAYIDDGKPARFWERPGGKTWRLMAGVTTKREAIRKASARDPRTIAGKFARLVTVYNDARCPDGKLKPRDDTFTKDEIARSKTLSIHFGEMSLDKMAEQGVALIPEYRDWRVERIPKGRRLDMEGEERKDFGGRTVDKDTQTLSNIFRFAVVAKLYPVNPFARGRPRYQSEENVSHSRDRAPKNADVIHAIADELFNKVSSEVVGWFSLFAMFSACRITELLRMRKDAEDSTFPGFVEWAAKPIPGKPLGLLHLGERENGGGRCKSGINPEILIGEEFAVMLKCFHYWHKQRFPDSKYYFPDFTGEHPINRRLVGRHIAAACDSLNLPHITPHGYRSFYVTKRRSDGESDNVIAGELGDKTVGLMQSRYGKRPPNWLNGQPLTWTPTEGLPAWARWQSAKEKIVSLH